MRRCLHKSLRNIITGVLVAAALAAAPVRAAASGGETPPSDVRVMVNGRPLAMDVPPLVVEGRVLVPLRAVAEALGARVAWDEPTGRIWLRSGDVLVALGAGERVATINGRSVPLAVPPVVRAGRTLVPLRFVGEALGASVGWSPVERTVSVERVFPIREIGFEEKEGKVFLTIRAGGPAPYHVAVPAGDSGDAAGEAFAAAARIVIDIPYAEVPPELRVLAVGRAGVRAVRAATLEGSPPTARLLVELERPVAWRVVEGDAKGNLVLDIAPAPQDGDPAGEAPTLAPGALSGRVIALDPGHGGQDPGAIGPGGTAEAEVVWDVVRVLKDLLQAEGARVVVTRAEGRGPDLYARAALANREKADAFVSIHLNAAETQSPAGTETYCHPAGGEGCRLAAALQRRLVAGLGRADRGVLTADFVVLRETAMPAALVELAYVSNPEEEGLLAAPDFRRRAAASILEGLRDFFAPLRPIPPASAI